MQIKTSIIFILSLVNLVFGHADLNLYKLEQLQVVSKINTAKNADLQ